MITCTNFLAQSWSSSSVTMLLENRQVEIIFMFDDSILSILQTLSLMIILKQKD